MTEDADLPLREGRAALSQPGRVGTTHAMGVRPAELPEESNWVVGTFGLPATQLPWVGPGESIRAFVVYGRSPGLENFGIFIFHGLAEHLATAELRTNTVIRQPGAGSRVGRWVAWGAVLADLGSDRGPLRVRAPASDCWAPSGPAHSPVRDREASL